MDKPPARVDFLNFGDSALELRLLYWITHPVLRTRIRSAVNFRINELIQEHGVEIPFPQRDLHLRSVDPGVIRENLVRDNPSGLNIPSGLIKVDDTKGMQGDMRSRSCT